MINKRPAISRPILLDYMKIKVRLYGGLKLLFRKKENEEDYCFVLNEDYTLEELINFLSLSGKTLIVIINGVVCNDTKVKLKDGDIVSFFPPIAGGE